jgi:hypothetical protein
MGKLGKGKAITQWESSISGQFLAWVALAHPLRSYKKSQSPILDTHAEAEELPPEPVSGGQDGAFVHRHPMDASVE